MGKLILCSGKSTNRPYVLPVTGYRIYSIEELCYYIYNNVYFINESLFTSSLIEWIGTELGLESRAEKLDQLIKQGADYKTMLAAVLCSADYYTEQEIKKLLLAVDEISAVAPGKRWYIRANSYLERKQYVEAAAEYDSLLASKEAADLNPKDYGDVLHNLAIASLHIYGPERAQELFFHAYERNRRDESLRQYLYTLWLCEDKEIFDEKLSEYYVNNIIREEIIQRMEQLSRDALQCKAMDEIYSLRSSMNTDEWTETSDRCSLIINRWIDEVRVI